MAMSALNSDMLSGSFIERLRTRDIAYQLEEQNETIDTPQVKWFALNQLQNRAKMILADYIIENSWTRNGIVNYYSFLAATEFKMKNDLIIRM